MRSLEGDHYIGCVRFEQEDFYSAACRTYQDAMSEAQKIGAMGLRTTMLCGTRQDHPP